MRRSYGSGQIIVRADAQGRETFYGRWWANGRRVKRRLGLKRGAGSREGLTASQAEAELRRQMLAASPGRGELRSVTIAEASERYVEQAKRRGRKASTCANVESEVRVHIAPFFRGKSLASIDHRDIAEFVRRLEGKGLAPKSVRNIVATLSALFNFAVLPQQGWVSSNPCRGVTLPGTTKRQTKVRFLHLEELDALIANVPESIFTEIDKAMILTAAQTG